MPIEPGNFSLGVLAGGLIGTLAGHLLTKSRNTEERKISAFNKAAAEFRAAFVDYIYQIRHTKNMTDFEIGFTEIRDDHTAIVSMHEKAKIRFEPFIDKDSRSSFEAAWEKYRQWPEQFKRQEDKADIKNTIINHMDILLAFAQLK